MSKVNVLALHTCNFIFSNSLRYVSYHKLTLRKVSNLLKVTLIVSDGTDFKPRTV